MALRLRPVACQANQRIKFDSEDETVSVKLASKYTNFLHENTRENTIDKMLVQIMKEAHYANYD